MTLIDTDRAVELYQGARVGGRDERWLGRQHDVWRRQLRRPCGLRRQGQRRRAGAGVRPRPARRRCGVPPGLDDRRRPDRPLHHRRHARRRAHDEHVPRRLEPAERARRRHRHRRRRQGAVHGGLPLRPRRGQGRRSGTPPRLAHRHGRLVSLTLSDSFCVDRHRDDFCRSCATRSTCCSGTTTS